MSFVSSPIGLVILGLATGLLTNVVYVVLDLETAARWLRKLMGEIVGTSWWGRLWKRLVDTGKQPVQWSPHPEDLSRRKEVLDQQYSTHSNASRENPSLEEEPDTSSMSSVVAYVQLNVPLARAFHEKLVDADGWEQVSETVLQKIEVVGKDFLAKAISALQAALEYDASSTLQIDGWGLFHCKPGGQIQLLKFEDGVHHVPAITSVYGERASTGKQRTRACGREGCLSLSRDWLLQSPGSVIKGLNLCQAEVQVSTQDSCQQLQCSSEVELPEGLYELFVTIPRRYNKPCGVYIMALKSILEGEEALVVKSKATPFLKDQSSGATGLFPCVCTPSTWILLLVSLCWFTVAVYYYTVHSRSACARGRKLIVGHYLLRSHHQAVLPSKIIHGSPLALVYKVALMMSAVTLVGVIKNRLNPGLRFILRRDLRLPDADNDLRLPEAVTVVYHVIESNGQVAVVTSPSPGMPKPWRRVSARNASHKVATLRPLKSCSETSPRNQSFSNGFRVRRCWSMN